MEFLAKTTQALTDTLVDMSECLVQQSGKDVLKNLPSSRRRDAVGNSSSRNQSPLQSLVHLVKWIQSTDSS